MKYMYWENNNIVNKQIQDLLLSSGEEVGRRGL
jgi:hypothetical protein